MLSPHLFTREPLDKAVVMALTEFLQLMQDDLEDGGLAEDEIKKVYAADKAISSSIKKVKLILGKWF